MAVVDCDLFQFVRTYLIAIQQFLIIRESICAVLGFISDVPKASTLRATLPFWSVNISLAVTLWAGDHSVFLGLKHLLSHLHLVLNLCFVLFPL